MIRNRARYRERDNSKGFSKLEYETELVTFHISTCAPEQSCKGLHKRHRLFWQNGIGGVVHQPDFWPRVADNVWVYRADVKRINGKEMYLDDEEGTHFPCDALLCGTGWQRQVGLFQLETLALELGLPHPEELEPLEMRRYWEKLILDADEAVLKTFLILQHPPPHPRKLQSSTPYRLYRGMAPLKDNTIIFLNHVTVANKLFAAEAQAMWAAA